MELKTVGRRHRSYIRMDGSVSEDSTSLDLYFTEKNGWKIYINMILLADHHILDTCNEKWKGERRTRKEGIGEHLPKAKAQHSVEEMLHINIKKS